MTLCGISVNDRIIFSSYSFFFDNANPNPKTPPPHSEFGHGQLNVVTYVIIDIVIVEVWSLKENTCML